MKLRQWYRMYREDGADPVSAGLLAVIDWTFDVDDLPPPSSGTFAAYRSGALNPR